MVFLTDNTSIGSEELVPILPSGAWALPEGILQRKYQRRQTLRLRYHNIRRFGKPRTVFSYIADNFVSGKQLYTRMLMHYALSLNDSLALGYINGFSEEPEAVAEAAAQISGYSSYVKTNTSILIFAEWKSRQRAFYMLRHGKLPEDSLQRVCQ